MNHPEFVEHTEAEAVFALLSDDNRIDILRALWRSDGPMTFSELHDAVDITDSGQFNYHLGKLVGRFVKDEENGYTLTAAGARINGAIEAGSYTTSGSMEPIILDSPCPSCSGDRTFEYEDELARVTCDSCDVVAEFSVPPSAFVDCEREEIPAVAGRYLRGTVRHLEDGFCSQCDGPVEREVCHLSESAMWKDVPEDSEDVARDIHNTPVVEYECLQCGMEPTAGLTFALVSAPPVISFYHDHGIDVRERSFWEFATFSEEHEHVRSDDPFRATATFSVDSDELTVVVDRNLTVVDTE
ncbi:ArsR/SmtB family transcription factor [Halovenus salina]|uniref:ArsR/SmtB family transcription factor n=1 Tax=Halovenus salina TaxID=1510225 RepID=A0ABD5W6N6_9EURY|nr:helix-turn-helix domain-containing protein [Halovenus salina]